MTKEYVFRVQGVQNAELAWDRSIERDLKAGRLDASLEEVRGALKDVSTRAL